MEKIIATMFLYKRKKLMQALIGYSVFNKNNWSEHWKRSLSDSSC